MSKVAIVYWSGTGNTEAMAAAVAEGVKSKGADASILTAGEFNAAAVAEYDAIAFGCPAMGAEVDAAALGCPAMGAEELEETEFAPMFDAVKSALAGKPVGLFGSYGWGDGEWMRSWEDRCKSDGAVLACDSVICNEAPDELAQDECKALGAALA